MIKLSDGQTRQPILGVKRKLWRQDDEHAILKDEKYKDIRESIFQRDDHKCQFCGFKFDSFQEVHHLDDDHGHNDKSNLVTICNLCHAVHHLGMTAIRNAGFLAYIPEMKQTDVNGICRIIFMQRYILSKSEEEGAKQKKDSLEALYSVFQSRGAKLSQLTQSDKINLTKPIILAQYLSTCDEELYSQRETMLSGLVLVPTHNAFTDNQLEKYFSSSGWKTHNLDAYKVLFEQLQNAAGEIT